MGWFFDHQPNCERRFVSDLRTDRDLVVIDALFPLWCVLSLALPFGLGWVIGGELAAGLTALLWAARFGCASCSTSPGASTRFVTPSGNARSTHA